MTALSDQLTAYLARLWSAPVLVRDLQRIPGGASRETYRFDAEVGGRTRRLILRRDPVGSLLDTDRELEFVAYRTAYGRLPVPEAVALEREGAELERPFFLMERIDGGVVPSPFAAKPFGDHAEAMGEAFFRALGRLHAIEPEGTPLGELLDRPSPEECWRIQLDHWAGVIERDALEAQPIAEAAIRRLRAHPPPPAQAVRIVHGDYRSGNMIHDGAGGLLAVLDWEMAHLGDPLEDLGWAFDPVWDHFEPGRACGMLPYREALAIWEAESGLTADPAALAWWRLFGAVKGRAIWLTAMKEYLAGGCTDPVLGISGWYVGRRHDVVLAEQLQAFAEAQA